MPYGDAANPLSGYWTLPSTMQAAAATPVLTEAWIDAILSNLYRLGGVAGTDSVRVAKSVDQSTPNGSLVALTWDAEQHDTDTLHDSISNNSLLYVRESGIYLVIGTVTWSSNATGSRAAYLMRSGTTINGI